MRLRITERQYKVLESNVSYTPEKIDEFVAQATKDLTDAQAFFRRNIRIIASISIFEVAEKMPKYEQKYKELMRQTDFMRKRSSEYSRILDMYRDEFPPNVSKLDAISAEYDNLQFDLGKIGDILESLMESTRRLVTFLKPDSKI